MKTLLLVLLLSTNAYSNDCTIVLKKKAPTAKTYYTPSGESLSLKVLKKLKPQCDFKVSMMSMAELHQFKINALKNKLGKLQAPKGTIDLGGL